MISHKKQDVFPAFCGAFTILILGTENGSAITFRNVWLSRILKSPYH